MQASFHTEASRLVPTAGLVIPVDFGYAHDRSEPKFATQSDTRNTPERKFAQRNERVRKTFGFRVGKRASRLWFNKVSLDRLSFSYSRARDAGVSYTARDTTVGVARNLVYDLSPRERPVRLWSGLQLNLLPNNLKFSIRDASSTPSRYTVNHIRRGTTLTDSLVRQSSSPSKTVALDASASLRPLQMLNVRYSMSEPRDFRITHPQNETERIRFLGYDFGLPTGRSEALGFDLTPRRFQFNWSTNYSDQRTLWGTTRPETHGAISNRTARLHFDFGLHRRVLKWMRSGPRGATPGAGRAPQRPADQRPESPPPGELPGPPPERPPDEDLAPGSAADRDSLGTPPAGAARPDSLAKRPRPSPLAPLWGFARLVAGIEPVRVDLSDGRTASYAGLADSPTGAFRYGLSRHSGLPGVRSEVPPTQTLRRTVELSSGVPLRGALRLGVKYKLDANVVESHTFNEQDVLTTIGQQYRRETTFPSLDLSINNVEKARLFGGALDHSNVTLGYSRTSSEGYNTNQLPGRTAVETAGRNDNNRSTLTANWAGQWKHGISSSLNLNQSTNAQIQPGPTRRDAVQRSLTGSARFRVAPKGGLHLPFLGSRGTLKSGMDVSVTGSYTTDDRKFFNNPEQPDKFIVEGRTTGIQFGTRGDYTLSRNMTGGIDLGYSRNHDAQAKRSISAVRVGFNLSFMF
jgi:hypothetical protein